MVDNIEPIESIIEQEEDSPSSSESSDEEILDLFELKRQGEEQMALKFKDSYQIIRESDSL